METKTIVIDIDDTISTHIDRDYINAIPNWDVIHKINSFYRNGWKIILHTARGMESLNGDIERIEKERGPILIDWLARHNVSYHELKFGKPLAVFYVDDKNLRPDEFVSLKYETLKGGSNDSVERIGNRVVKKSKLTQKQKDWFKIYKSYSISDLFLTPEVYTYYGDTLEMEYIDGKQLHKTLTFNKFKSLIELVDSFKYFPSQSKLTWLDMVDRLKDHMSLIPEISDYNKNKVLDLLTSNKVVEFFNNNKSFSHGDLTLENIIDSSSNDMFLLDPISGPDVYCSWVLDIGKVLQSIYTEYEYIFGDDETNRSAYHGCLSYLNIQYKDMMPFFMIALMTCYIRMIKYKKNNEARKIAIDILNNLIIECEKGLQ